MSLYYGDFDEPASKAWRLGARYARQNRKAHAKRLYGALQGEVQREFHCGWLAAGGSRLVPPLPSESEAFYLPFMPLTTQENGNG